MDGMFDDILLFHERYMKTKSKKMRIWRDICLDAAVIYQFSSKNRSLNSFIIDSGIPTEIEPECSNSFNA